MSVPRRERDFRRIDVLNDGETAESRAIDLLDELREGRIGVKDLMGPIGGAPGLGPAWRRDRERDRETVAGAAATTTNAAAPVAPAAEFLPGDANDLRLIDCVYPPSHANPAPREQYDLVVVGAGPAGLISCIMAHWLGQRVALVESHAMGGDCLNTGCVPSKALLACANAFHALKHAQSFGVKIDGTASIDFAFVMNRMREIRSRIAKHDSVRRYSAEFCEHVFLGHARFTSKNELCVTDSDGGAPNVLCFRKAMIATGVSPNVPSLLSSVPHLTSNSFFNLQALPPRLLVLGGGPVATELAQAMSRLGSEVTCLYRGERLLAEEDAAAVEVLTDQLRRDGVIMYSNVTCESIEYSATDDSNSVRYTAPWGLYKLCATIDGERKVFEAEAILNATGRVPNVVGLGLDKAGVEWDSASGVHVDSFFRTSNSDIYACGDCTSPFKFTHAADFQARAAVRNMFLGDVHQAQELLIPHCIYTSPEIASVGKNEEQLKSEGIDFEILIKHLGDVDRCICDGEDQGFVKVIVRASSTQIVGATICAPRAGDMISEITLCMQYGIDVTQLAGAIHPYPTAQEAVRGACLGFNKYFKNRNGAPYLALQLLMNDKNEL